jgi:hypothetical protein
MTISKRTHVRGALAPANSHNFKVENAGKIRDAFFDAGLARMMNNGEISEQGVIEFNFSYGTALGHNLPTFIANLKKYLRSKHVNGLNLNGKITVIMDSNGDFPKLYLLTVERGAITVKEGVLKWEEQKIS